MKEKIAFLSNEDQVERRISEMMKELEVNEVSQLLEDIDVESSYVNPADLQDIKARTVMKLNHGTPVVTQPNEELHVSNQSPEKRRHSRYLRYTAAVAGILLFLFVWTNNERIVSAFQNIFSLIPGVGIVENRPDIRYRLKEEVTVENDRGTLQIKSVVATNDTMSISFEFTRKNYTEEQLIADKNAEWEELKKGNNPVKPAIYLAVDGTKYEMSFGSSGSGLSEFYNFTFVTKDMKIEPTQRFTLLYEEYQMSADFELISLEEYTSLDDIGSSDIHNNIILTATASKKEGDLSVHVYPVNYSSYSLISFDQEYDLNYFGKKITLMTEKGNKGYTLPGSYGSGMNAAYTFDVKDGSEDYTLSIPYVVVESDEESKVTLPIPKVGEVIELNKEIKFENGSVIIRSVEKVLQGNEYGDLKITLDYVNNQSDQQLVNVKLTNKKSEGWSEEYDEENRLKTIYYMLNKSDHSKLKLYVTKPRYALMEEYQLKLNDQK